MLPGISLVNSGNAMRTKLADGYYVYYKPAKATINKVPIRHSDSAYWEMDANNLPKADLMVIDQDYNEVSPSGKVINVV